MKKLETLEQSKQGLNFQGMGFINFCLCLPKFQLLASYQKWCHFPSLICKSEPEFLPGWAGVLTIQSAAQCAELREDGGIGIEAMFSFTKIPNFGTM